MMIDFEIWRCLKCLSVFAEEDPGKCPQCGSRAFVRR